MWGLIYARTRRGPRIFPEFCSLPPFSSNQSLQSRAMQRISDACTSPVARLRRKQKSSACQRCNKRKVRCDASVSGVPCSECKARLEACTLLQWKRIRIACVSFDTGRESNRTTMILSSYLLQYGTGNATKYRDTLWWLGNSIRSAQCMGFHRSTKNSKMPERTKIHWKRVWWCLYIRDRQVSLSTGPPMVINDIDFDVEDLTMDDFPDEPPETARYIIAQASLNKAASNMFFCHCSPRRLALSHDPQARGEARQQIQAVLEGWYAQAVLPSGEDEKHFLNLILKVCYQ